MHGQTRQEFNKTNVKILTTSIISDRTIEMVNVFSLKTARKIPIFWPKPSPKKQSTKNKENKKVTNRKFFNLFPRKEFFEKFHFLPIKGVEWRWGGW